MSYTLTSTSRAAYRGGVDTSTAYAGYEITWKTFDLHENEPEWNIRTEHEGMFTEMGIKIKALIARKKAGDDSVTWVEPKVLKKLAAQAEAEASAKAEGEGNV